MQSQQIQQQELSYVSAPCGSGKTYSTIHHIATFGELLRKRTKNALDPVDWLKVLPERTKLAPVEYDASCSAPTIAPTNKEERIQNALDRYNSSPQGTRHHEGYRLVYALLAIEGGDESNIGTHLNRAYSFDYDKLNDRNQERKTVVSE